MSGEPYKMVSSRKAPRNRLVLTLYSCGYTPQEIVQIFEKDGVRLTYNMVRGILTSPQAGEVLQEIEKNNEQELQQLFGSANSVLREAMRSPDPKIALAGAALFYRVSGRITQNVKVTHTAEDVVAQLMQEAERRRMEREGVYIDAQ